MYYVDSYEIMTSHVTVSIIPTIMRRYIHRPLLCLLQQISGKRKWRLLDRRTTVTAGQNLMLGLMF